MKVLPLIALACICMAAVAKDAVSSTASVPSRESSDLNGAVVSNECGEVTIAGMNWASAALTAAIDRHILSSGFGCTVEITAGDAVPAMLSMRDTGKPDLIPEIWVDALMPQIDQAMQAGTIELAVEVFSNGGEQGWWIPDFIARQHPEIKTVADALARPDLFTSKDDESVAALYNCPDGWDCHAANINLYRAFNVQEQGFEIVNTGSAAELDASIARAFEQKVGWLGYYWTPASVLGRYKMFKLDMGTHDKEHWETCTLVPECSNPQPNAWPSSSVLSLVSGPFASNNSGVMDYISARQWQRGTLNALLAWAAENQASAEEAAIHFLKQYGDIWAQWVSDDIAVQVRSAL